MRTSLATTAKPRPVPGRTNADNPVEGRRLDYVRPNVSNEAYWAWVESTKSKYPGYCRAYLLNKKTGCTDGDCKLKHDKPPNWDEHLATCGT